MEVIKQEKRIKLELKHAFGSSTKGVPRDSITIFDNEQDRHKVIVFPVGKFIAVYQLEENQMNFIKVNPLLEGINCMTYSPNKQYVAICEKLGKKDQDQLIQYEVQQQQRQLPTLVVYNLKNIIQDQVVTKQSVQQSSGGNLEQKVFVYSDTIAESFRCVKFSDDSRFLVLVTGAPEFKIIFIDFSSKMKEIAQGTIGLEVSRVSFDPKDSHHIVVSGEKIFKTFYIKEKGIIPGESVRKLNQNLNFVDHCWYDETVLVVSTQKDKKSGLGGEVYLIQDNEIKQVIRPFFEVPKQIENDKDKKSIFMQRNTYAGCIQSFPKGVIFGSESGFFSIWLKNEDTSQETENDLLVYLRGWSSDRYYGAVAMSLTPQDLTLAVAFANNDLATFDLNQILPQMGQIPDQYRRNRKLLEKKHRFEFLHNGFHYGAISCLDVCIQRPLMVTCSAEDSTIRIWNYLDFRCEVSRRLTPEKFDVEGLPAHLMDPSLNCVAFHPSGYYLAVGTISSLQFYHVLHKSLRLYQEVQVKNVKYMKFSNGGQFLAIAFEKKKQKDQKMYLIQIYNAWTMEAYLKLSQRTQQCHNAPVTEMVWGPNDDFLLSCGQDGVAFVYRYLQSSDSSENQWVKEEYEYQDKGLKFKSVIYQESEQSLMFCGGGGGGGQAAILQRKTDLPDQPWIKSLTPNFEVSCLADVRTLHDFHNIVAGLENGGLNVYPFQGNDFSGGATFQQLAMHQGAVNKVRSSPDGMYVFSAGADGALFVYRVYEYTEDGHLMSTSVKQSNEKELEKLNPWAECVVKELADVVLVQRSEILNYLNEQKELKKEYEDLENKMEFQAQEEKRKMEEKIAFMKQSMNEEIQTWSKRYTELQNQKTKIEQESSNLLKLMENNHLKAVEELENLYEKKLSFENEKYMQQEQILLEERMKFDQKLKNIQRDHNGNIEDLRSEFEKNFSRAQGVYETTKETANALRMHYEEKLDQQEEEHEQEIREMKDRHSKEVEDLKYRLTQLQYKLEQSERLSKMASDDKEKIDKEKKDIVAQKAKLEERLQDAHNQIQTFKDSQKKSEEQLSQKEKKIAEYRYKINDLQKQKHVLSFRTTEMRRALEPKDSQIEKLKEDLCKLEGELDNMLKQSQQQNDNLKRMKNQIDTLNGNLQKQIQLTQIKDAKLNAILMDIYNTVNGVDMKLWNNSLMKLYENHVKSENTLKKPTHDPKGLEEMKTHVKHLEKSIHQINKSSEKIIMRREHEVYQKLKENADLIYDLNEMRKLNKELMTDQQNKKREIENLQKQNANLNLEIKRIRGAGNNFRPQSTNFSQQQQPIEQFQQPPQTLPPNNNNFERPQTREVSQRLPPPGNYNRPQSMKNSRQGKILKGPNFDSKTLGTFDRAKMNDLIAESELQANRLVQQEVVLREVREKIRKHVNDKNCTDNEFERELQILYNFEQYGMEESMSGQK